MSVLSLRLPNSMHSHMKDLAQQEGVSINQFIMLAVAEKMAALDTKEYIQKRALRGSRQKLLAVLAKSPDGEPDAADRLPR
ncbi:MAG: toxin-antitoxin system HicB family antitoxin [Caldilineaceae bacterium]